MVLAVVLVRGDEARCGREGATRLECLSWKGRSETRVPHAKESAREGKCDASIVSLRGKSDARTPRCPSGKVRGA